MKLKKLESLLSSLEHFHTPKVELEQYPTSAHLAACMVWAAHTMHDDIAGRTVADLGCGTGMLTAGALLLGAQHITALDVDPDAIAQAQDNLSSLGAEEGEDVTFQLADLGASDGAADGACPVPLVDTVIMNPPFGTRVEGIDVHFLTLAVRRARRAVYSMHKSSTRAHILKVASQLGAPATTLATMRFPIPRMYAHHTQDSVDVEVDLVRLDTSGVDHTGSVSEGVGSATPPTAAAAAAAAAATAGPPHHGGDSEDHAPAEGCAGASSSGSEGEGSDGEGGPPPLPHDDLGDLRRRPTGQRWSGKTGGGGGKKKGGGRGAKAGGGGGRGRGRSGGKGRGKRR